ncbi:MAG: 50S ribosomal protein L4 [Candidatus Aureabacteria bacterium]|nr:50S ribosomal protein L4 [Candidatus Auribacterota bacterium]
MVKELMNIDVVSAGGSKIESLTFDVSHFDTARAERLISDVGILYEANQKKHTAKVKSRAEIWLSGRKPWKQKGTGRARSGSFRSPIWVGGGVAFGPKPRDTYYTIPKKLRKRALRDVLILKIREGQLLVVDDLKIDEIKTKKIIDMLKTLKCNEKTMLITAMVDPKLVLSCRNVKRVVARTVGDLNAYDLLLGGKLLFTKEAFNKINKELVA